MTRKIEFHQWPNVLSLDAALIAVVWQAALAGNHDTALEWPAHAVLGLSVWLTYMADRLFDVYSRPMEYLKSIRHRFAKKHWHKLWRTWCGVLILNLCIATQLSMLQLEHGSALLIVCLLYTLLNQKLSRRFFPKEICVALIFAGGVVVLIPATIPLGITIVIAWLCLMNCLIIGAREKEIDAHMRVHSIASVVTERYLAPLALASAVIIAFTSKQFGYELATCSIVLGVLHLLRKKIELENFRVLADAMLLVGGLLALGSV